MTGIRWHKTNQEIGRQMITIRKFEAKDVARMAEIWNQVVEDGVAFPQEEGLTGAEAAEFLPHRR